MFDILHTYITLIPICLLVYLKINKILSMRRPLYLEGSQHSRESLGPSSGTYTLYKLILLNMMSLVISRRQSSVYIDASMILQPLLIFE